MLIALCLPCSPIVNRRKKDCGDAKSAADAAGKKDERKQAKKPAKKGKRGREASTGTSVPVRLASSAPFAVLLVIPILKADAAAQKETGLHTHNASTHHCSCGVAVSQD